MRQRLKPPCPNKTIFEQKRHYRSGEKKSLIFFIFPLDNSAGWLYIQIINRQSTVAFLRCTPNHFIANTIDFWTMMSESR